MSNPLKVGVIGVGGIAGTHFPGWKASEHSELVGMADPVAPVLARLAKEHGVTKTYENPQDLINDPDIDLIDICTPSAYHAPLAIAALNAGKHVICEKPLAPTPKDIEDMIAARDKSGKYLMTAPALSLSKRHASPQARNRHGHLGRRLSRPLVDAAPQRPPDRTRLHPQKELWRRPVH